MRSLEWCLALFLALVVARDASAEAIELRYGQAFSAAESVYSLPTLIADREGFFAREGLRFRYAHVTVAVCQPSRECLMTGRYPIRAGVPNNGPPLKPSEQTIAAIRTMGSKCRISSSAKSGHNVFWYSIRTEIASSGKRADGKDMLTPSPPNARAS